MTEQEINEWKKIIDNMGQAQMASIWRFARAGHPIFCNINIYDYFKEKFNSLGGMTPEISKKIGW